MSTFQYVLDGHKPVPEPSTLAWSEWMRGADRQVALTDFGEGEPRISTVFLGVDHGFGGVPILFETMIFGGEHDGKQWRYATWKAAERHHESIVQAIVAGKELP